MLKPWVLSFGSLPRKGVVGDGWDVSRHWYDSCLFFHLIGRSRWRFFPGIFFPPEVTLPTNGSPIQCCRGRPQPKTSIHRGVANGSRETRCQRTGETCRQVPRPISDSRESEPLPRRRPPEGRETIFTLLPDHRPVPLRADGFVPVFPCRKRSGARLACVGDSAPPVLLTTGGRAYERPSNPIPVSTRFIPGR